MMDAKNSFVLGTLRLPQRIKFCTMRFIYAAYALPDEEADI